MRSIKYNLFFIILFFCFSITAQEKSKTTQTYNGRDFYIHTIEKGQSLYSISKLYTISLDTIYSFNPELKEGAKAGQEIRIPQPIPKKSSPLSVAQNAFPSDTSKYVYYTVKKSETVYAITKRFKISNDYFYSKNPGSNQGLKEGQIVIVGDKKPSAETPVSKIYTTTIIPKKDTTTPVRINLPKKEEYTVALILPFKSSDADAIQPAELVKANMNFPQISGIAVDYYVGFQHALDSLKSSGFNIKTRLFDLDDDDSLNLEMILTEIERGGIDFIFGPLYASSFKTVSEKARDHSIPIVSPITQQNKFLFENVFASKTNPSNYTLLESLANYIVDSLVKKGTNAVLYQAISADKKEQAYCKAFKSYYQLRLEKRGMSEKDSLKTVYDLASVKKYYSSNQPMVVINLNNNQVLITDFTTQLALFANKKDITLCGWKAVSEIENLDQEYLNQLNFTFPCATDITNANKLPSVILKYKSQMNTYPSDYYFLGYDISFYYLKNLKELGPGFIFRLNELPYEGQCLKLHFTRPDNATGFDNIGTYILTYDQYRLRKTGWK